jgi:hypothetical protein
MEFEFELEAMVDRKARADRGNNRDAIRCGPKGPTVSEKLMLKKRMLEKGFGFQW